MSSLGSPVSFSRPSFIPAWPHIPIPTAVIREPVVATSRTAEDRSACTTKTTRLLPIGSLIGTLGLRSTYFSLNKSYSPFDTWGVACVFGGDEAVSAISTIHVYGNSRWWMGCYNSPGSYHVAKRLGVLGRSGSPSDLPSPTADSASPVINGASSTIDTSRASPTMDSVSSITDDTSSTLSHASPTTDRPLPTNNVSPTTNDTFPTNDASPTIDNPPTINASHDINNTSPTQAIDIDPALLDKLNCPVGPKFRATHSGTVIEETSHLAAFFMAECAAQQGNIIEGRKSQNVGVTVAELKHTPPSQLPVSRCPNAYSSIFSSIPVAVSIATCITCGIFDDWCSSMLIFSGILTSGVSCFAVGSGKLTFIRPEPSKNSPAGDGILGTGNEMVLLKGKEGAVNSITRGKFSLRFDSKRQYKNIRWCSLFLKIQSVAQLLFVPRCSIFGQTMFVTSLGVSWIYNSWLSSDKKKIQRDILLNNVLKTPVLTRYIFGTRTAAVVFIILVLHPTEPRKILNELLPNDTRVWNEWKRWIEQLLDGKEFHCVARDRELAGFDNNEKDLFKTLWNDAEVGYNAHAEYIRSK